MTRPASAPRSTGRSIDVPEIENPTTLDEGERRPAGVARALPPNTELICSELGLLEISRTLLRASADPTRVPYYVGQAARGIRVIDLTRPVLARARAYEIAS